MSYGLQTFAADGTLIFDTKRLGGVVVGMVSLQGRTTGSVAYPDFTGRTMFAMNQYDNLTVMVSAHSAWSISHPGGVPTLTWDYDSAGTYGIGAPINLILFVR